MTEAEREKLVSEGATTQGMVDHSESSPTDRRMSQVRVSVRFKDGQAVEFSQSARCAEGRSQRPAVVR